MAKCSFCPSHKRKISGTMAKKMNTGALQDVLFAAGGVLAAKFANKISFLSANPMVAGLAKAGVGFYLASQKNPALRSAGLGMAAVGATELVQSFLPAGSLGWAPTGSTTTMGVNGARPRIVVD